MDALRQLRFQLLGYATALAVLVNYTDIGWSGAPALAIGLWAVLAVINHIGCYETRRRT